jgi:hypothetical protein
MGLLIPYGEKAIQHFPGTQVTPPSRPAAWGSTGQTQLDIPV